MNFKGLAATLSVAVVTGLSAEAQTTTPCAEIFALLVTNPAAAAAQLESQPSEGMSCQSGEPEEALLRAYVAYKAQGERSPEALNLQRAVKDYDKAGGASSRLLGLSLNGVARQQLAEGKEHALRTAERAEQVFLAAAPNDKASRSNAIIWQAAARLIKQPNFSSDTVDAFKDVSRARSLLEGDEESTDQAFLKAVAWQAAILGIVAGDRRAAVDDAAASGAMGLIPDECDALWTREALATVRRRRPWSGHLMTGGGLLGAIAIINARPDGTSELVGIAAEARFPTVDPIKEQALRSRDKSVERSLDRWRVAADARPECRSGVLAPLGVYVAERGGAGGILNELPQNYEPAE